MGDIETYLQGRIYELSNIYDGAILYNSALTILAKKSSSTAVLNTRKYSSELSFLNNKPSKYLPVQQTLPIGVKYNQR